MRLASFKVFVCGSLSLVVLFRLVPSASKSMAMVVLSQSDMDGACIASGCRSTDGLGGGYKGGSCTFRVSEGFGGVPLARILFTMVPSSGCHRVSGGSEDGIPSRAKGKYKSGG